MLDHLNLPVRGSGFISRKLYKTSINQSLAHAVARSTGLTSMECDSLLKITFEEIINVLLTYGRCEIEIGYFNLRYNKSHIAVTFHLKPEYTKKINEKSEDVSREIIFK
jgi:nucleoid DNA-binding protein